MKFKNLKNKIAHILGHRLNRKNIKINFPKWWVQFHLSVPSRFYSRIYRKRNKIFSFPVIKRTTEQSRLIRILAISCILTLNIWCRGQESTFNWSFLLYCKNFGRSNFPKLKNFGRFYFRTLFLSDIKIVRNVLQVMYYINIYNVEEFIIGIFQKLNNCRFFFRVRRYLI